MSKLYNFQQLDVKTSKFVPCVKVPKIDKTQAIWGTDFSEVLSHKIGFFKHGQILNHADGFKKNKAKQNFSRSQNDYLQASCSFWMPLVKTLDDLRCTGGCISSLPLKQV